MIEGGQMLNKSLVVVVTLALLSAVAAAQQSPSESSGTSAASAVLERQLSRVEKELLPMANEMPADKFNFAPTNGEFKGVRSFAEQIKHMTGGNYRISAAIMGEKPPAAAAAVADAKTKDQIVKALAESFAYAHKAFGTVTEKNLLEPIPSPFGSGGTTTRLDLAIALMADQRDHYGQMVVYFRMNGMVPPASRR
jgi:uncharacterized damage-inducible protein DinB